MEMDRIYLPTYHLRFLVFILFTHHPAIKNYGVVNGKYKNYENKIY